MRAIIYIGLQGQRILFKNAHQDFFLRVFDEYLKDHSKTYIWCTQSILIVSFLLGDLNVTVLVLRWVSRFLIRQMMEEHVPSALPLFLSPTQTGDISSSRK